MKIRKQHPDPKALRELFDYDDQSGRLIWRFRPQSSFKDFAAFRAFDVRFKGKPAGYLKTQGYIEICINGSGYYSHRLIWIYHNGPIPDGMEIDHRHGITKGDKIENLRLLTHEDNMKNAKKASVNKSGMRGVHWSKTAKKWVAMIYVNGKNTYIGASSDIEKAKSLIIEARKQNGYKDGHGREA